VRIRSYRSVTVCMVLLCVVLLTEVIVLGVRINTHYTQEETHPLLTKITNLTEETKQLLTHNNNLINERDVLLWKNEELAKERDTLRQVCFKEYSKYCLPSSILIVY